MAGAQRARRPREIVDRVLIIPDCHRPFHSKRAWRVLLAAAKELEPTIVVVLGDFLDGYSVTGHGKSPTKRALLLHDEIASALEGLNDLDALGAKRKVFLEGNHCKRLKKYISERAPDLYGITSIPELLDLKKRGWEWHDYQEHVTIGKIHYVHDVGRSGANAVRQSLAAMGGSVVFGHTHRLGWEICGDLSGNSHVGASLGWLGDEEAAKEYMPRSAMMRNWHMGFGVGYIEDNGTTHIVPVPIIHNRCVVGGKLINP